MHLSYSLISVSVSVQSFLSYIALSLPRTESMKVHFLGILVLTAVLLETTDAVCNKRMSSRNRRVPLKPCRNLVFYYHDILYNGSNDHNATSALVAAPKGDNLTALASNHNSHFGQMVVFDDPLTLDNNLHSPPVARAQGFYFYDMKNIFGAWFSFTIVLDSKNEKGTITLAGADPATVDVRDMSVVGGTGDFLMTRGIATLTTDTFQGEAYFHLRLNITLYECH